MENNTGSEVPERQRSGVERVYRNDQISVYWEPKLCIHVGNCFRGAPGVFQPNRRPWVMLDAGDADQIAKVVMSCPTGALHFERHDGGPQEADLLEQEDAAEGMVINVRPNGPLYVRGRVKIEGLAGWVMREDTRLALCRCGASSNKPFCDGSHRQIGFRAMEKPEKPES